MGDENPGEIVTVDDYQTIPGDCSVEYVVPDDAKVRRFSYSAEVPVLHCKAITVRRGETAAVLHTQGQVDGIRAKVGPFMPPGDDRAFSELSQREITEESFKGEWGYTRLDLQEPGYPTGRYRYVLPDHRDEITVAFYLVVDSDSHGRVVAWQEQVGDD